MQLFRAFEAVFVCRWLFLGLMCYMTRAWNALGTPPKNRPCIDAAMPVFIESCLERVDRTLCTWTTVTTSGIHQVRYYRVQMDTVLDDSGCQKISRVFPIISNFIQFPIISNDFQSVFPTRFPIFIQFPAHPISKPKFSLRSCLDHSSSDDRYGPQPREPQLGCGGPKELAIFSI